MSPASNRLGSGAAGLVAESDPWLGGQLGRPAWWARFPQGSAGEDISGRLGNERMFVAARLPASDTSVIAALEETGFNIVDLTLTFEGTASWEGNDPEGVRFAGPEDRKEVAALAGRAFRFSRFHLDPVIPNPLADRIKAAWAENFFSGGRGDAMILAEAEGRTAGFLQLLKRGDDTLVIDLIAVAEPFRGRGLARDMIAFAGRHGTRDGSRPSRLLAGTQAANVPSLRFYENLGFRLFSSQVVLHHHGADKHYSVAEAEA